MIVRKNKLEDSFLAEFHTQQLLAPDGKIIISTRTINSESKLSLYYPKSIILEDKSLDIMLKGLKNPKKFLFKKVDAKCKTILKIEISQEDPKNRIWVCKISGTYFPKIVWILRFKGNCS